MSQSLSIVHTFSSYEEARAGIDELLDHDIPAEEKAA